MNGNTINDQQVATLTALAQGIIPADSRDDGAASVDAGARLAEKIRSGINTTLYLNGLRAAQVAAREQFDKPVTELTPIESTRLLECLRGAAPGFVKQLRMDVSALYLSDPAVWQRIGFPGPSFENGGYPDFDQPRE